MEPGRGWLLQRVTINLAFQGWPCLQKAASALGSLLATFPSSLSIPIPLEFQSPNPGPLCHSSPPSVPKAIKPPVPDLVAYFQGDGPVMSFMEAP